MYKISSLSVKCGNYYRNGISKYKLVKLALPDFRKINLEISYLKDIEEKVEEAEEAAIKAL